MLRGAGEPAELLREEGAAPLFMPLFMRFMLFQPSMPFARASGRLKVATDRDPGAEADLLPFAMLPFVSRRAKAAGPITERSTSMFAIPWCATSEETSLSPPKSRGTPRPAESLRNVKVPGAEMLETESGRVLTGTIAGAPPRGGSGAAPNARFPAAAAGARAATFWSP